MQLADNLLKEYDDLYVVVAGADRQAYSYPAPTVSGSWKEYQLSKLSDRKVKRIVFTGLLNYTDYRTLLWRSNLPAT